MGWEGDRMGMRRDGDGIAGDGMGMKWDGHGDGMGMGCGWDGNGMEMGMGWGSHGMGWGRGKITCSSSFPLTTKTLARRQDSNLCPDFVV